MVAKTKDVAIAEVPSYVTPHGCFVWFKNTKEGWSPISGTPCAHYVAHEKGIKIASQTALKCDKGYVIRVSQVIGGLQKRDNLNQVQKGDVWASATHTGIVTKVIPAQKDKKPTIEITHCSSRAKAVITSLYGSDISGGAFYAHK